MCDRTSLSDAEVSGEGRRKKVVVNVAFELGLAGIFRIFHRVQFASHWQLGSLLFYHLRFRNLEVVGPTPGC